MASNDRGVPRGDHVPAAEQEDSIEMQEQQDGPDLGGDTAARRGHGAHGKGGQEEVKLDAQSPKPDFAKGTDRGGSAAWGGAPSGGSTFDKRSPDK